MKHFLALAALLTMSSCQIGYYWHISYQHLKLLSSTKSLDAALQSDSLNEEQKNKIRLTKEVREFAFSELQLYKSGSYSKIAILDRPYVTYTVSASEKWQLKPYLWNFLFVGKAPYKGYYNKALADEEAESLKTQNYDTTVRGVSAFSTLGKMSDPLLSSMLLYSDHDLVNTLIHELVHSTLFIKDNVDFNERLAVFVAAKGTEIFYLKKEGPESENLKKIINENEDDFLFSRFIAEEISDLKKWYEQFDHTKSLPETDKENIRQERLLLIKERFEKQLLPRLKSKAYTRVFSRAFNNADLSMHGTYTKNLDVFEKVYKKNGSSIPLFLKKCAELNEFDNPEQVFENWAAEK